MDRSPIELQPGNAGSPDEPNPVAFRICVSTFAAAAVCLVAAAIAVALVPSGWCMTATGRAPAAPQDAMWSALGGAGVFGLAGLIAWAGTVERAPRRTRIVLAAVVLIEIAAGVAIITFFGHQTYHWSDCG